MMSTRSAGKSADGHQADATNKTPPTELLQPSGATNMDTTLMAPLPSPVPVSTPTTPPTVSPTTQKFVPIRPRFIQPPPTTPLFFHSQMEGMGINAPPFIDMVTAGHPAATNIAASLTRNIKAMSPMSRPRTRSSKTAAAAANNADTEMTVASPVGEPKRSEPSTAVEEAPASKKLIIRIKTGETSRRSSVADLSTADTNTATPEQQTSAPTSNSSDGTVVDLSTVLKPLQDSEGGLKDVDSIRPLLQAAWPLKSASGKELVLNLLTCTRNVNLLEKITATKFMALLKQWLIQAHKEQMMQLITQTLTVLGKLPMTVELLKTSQLGKVLKSFSKHQDASIAAQSAAILASWMKLVEEQKTVNLVSPSDDAEPVVVSAATLQPGSAVKQQAPASTAPLAKPKQMAMAIDIFKDLGASKAKKPKLERPRTIGNLADINSSLQKSPPVFEVKPSSASSQTSDPVADILQKLSGEDGPVSTSSAGGKKKKRVTWAPDHQLRSIRLFQVEETERSGAKHRFKNAREMERNEAQAVREQKRREMEPQAPWQFPIALASVDFAAVQSREMSVQQERISTVLAALYFGESQIPPSPSEPPIQDRIGDPTTAKQIPLEDVNAAANAQIAAAQAALVQPNLQNLMNNPAFSQLLQQFAPQQQPQHQPHQIPMPTQQPPPYPLMYNAALNPFSANAALMPQMPPRQHQKQKQNRQQKPQEVCRFYLQGRCTKGDACRFSHSNIPTTHNSNNSINNYANT